MSVRLPYKLPEWAPIVIYVSKEARETWQPRISAISNAWIQAERDSVAAGIRKSALQHVTPEQLPELLKQEAKRGLSVLPLGQVAKTTGYQSGSKDLRPGDAFDYKVVITTPDLAATWVEVWSISDDEKIGELLSTPPCCIAAFSQYWVKERWIDLTWPTHQNTPEISGYNGLLRWLGVRGVSYLPCSPVCEATLHQSERLINIMSTQEAEWLREMLSWPTLWTSLNGIAEITNPILKMSVPSDALEDKAEIKLLGFGYPDEGASGKSFPFRIQKALSAKSQNPGNNGFTSREAQDTAHKVLLKELEGKTFNTVLDLGCGDGTLLGKITCKRRVGIELDRTRAKQANIDRVIIGNCEDSLLLSQIIYEEEPDLIIAQRDRNPSQGINSKAQILSYTYENKTEAVLWT